MGSRKNSAEPKQTDEASSIQKPPSVVNPKETISQTQFDEAKGDFDRMLEELMAKTQKNS